MASPRISTDPRWIAWSRPPWLALLICLLAIASFAQAATTDLGLSPYQAQTAWVSPHRDQQNTDFVPFATATRYQVRWHVETGNLTIWPAAVGPEGNLYTTTGRAGDPTVHAYGIDGILRWETGVPAAGSDPNPVAAAQLPFTDVDGDVYVSDNESFWAFRSDGSLKWKTAFPVHPDGPSAFIGAPVVTSAGLIGGITNRGQVLFYDRATGAQAIPTFELPGGPAPVGSATPAGLWAGGEIDPAFADIFWAGLNGYELEVANTQAIHPDSDRLYITATSSTSSTVGALYALDLLDGAWQIAFETPLGANSGTSPALSPDGRQVYAVGGDNELAAYDAFTGALLWTAPDVSGLASPQVGPDGTVYSGTATGSHAIALRPDGTLKWRRNYDHLARRRLAPVPAAGTILVDGRPVARADSVATVTATNVKVVLKLGYDFQPPGGAVNTTPNIVLLASLSPVDGRVLDHVEIPDDCRGVLSVKEDGHVFVSHAAAFTSIFYYFANLFLPESIRIPGPPPAGLTALRPVSFLDQTIAGLSWARALAAEAQASIAAGEHTAALMAARRAAVQLGASAASFADAEADGEITSADAAARAADTTDAGAHFTAAKTALAADPVTPADLATASAELTAAVAAIDAALEGLPCDDGVLCTSGDTYSAGTCRGVAATGLSRLKLRVTLRDGALSAARDRITIRATLPLADLPSSPTVTGLTVEVATGDGDTFYSGTAPAAAFVDAGGRGVRFRFADRDRAIDDANGLTKVRVRKNTARGTVRITARIEDAETVAADGHDTLSVSFLFGADPLAGECLGAPFMTCAATPGRNVVCETP